MKIQNYANPIHLMNQCHVNISVLLRIGMNVDIIIFNKSNYNLNNLLQPTHYENSFVKKRWGELSLSFLIFKIAQNSFHALVILEIIKWLQLRDWLIRYTMFSNFMGHWIHFHFNCENDTLENRLPNYSFGCLESEAASISQLWPVMMLIFFMW